jgi:hypothetical protein
MLEPDRADTPKKRLVPSAVERKAGALEYDFGFAFAHSLQSDRPEMAQSIVKQALRA